MLVTTGKKPVHVCRHSEGLVTLETCGRSDEGHDHFQIFGNFSDFGEKISRFTEIFRNFRNLSYFWKHFIFFGNFSDFRKILRFSETFQILGKYSDFWKLFRISETYHISGNFSYLLETFQIFGKYPDFWILFRLSETYHISGNISFHFGNFSDCRKIFRFWETFQIIRNLSYFWKLVMYFLEKHFTGTDVVTLRAKTIRDTVCKIYPWPHISKLVATQIRMGLPGWGMDWAGLCSLELVKDSHSLMHPRALETQILRCIPIYLKDSRFPGAPRLGSAPS